MTDLLRSVDVHDGTASVDGMRWIPGGDFLMGSNDFYPEERPVHRVSVDGFWMDEHPVTVADFRRFVRVTGYVTVAERPLDPAEFPDADPDLLVPGSLLFRKTAGPVDLDDYRNWWGYVAGVSWKTARGPEHDDQGPQPAPRRPRRVRGRGGVRRVGREGSSDRGRVGVRCARRARGRRLRVGRRAFPGRQGDGQQLAGRVPVAEPEARRFRRDVSGRRLPTERLRRVRNDRERLGVDVRLVHASPSRRGAEPVLRPGEPTRDRSGRELPARAARGAHPPPREQGRLAPVRAELLSPLSTAARQAQQIDSSMAHLGFRGVARTPDGAGGGHDLGEGNA